MANDVPVGEIFWSLLDKADKKFVRLRELPSYGKHRYDSYFHKVFKIYTQLWKFQQENRQKLVEAGVKRCDIGEIAYRIAQLYYSQYARTSELSYLSESYIFYEAIIDREYFKENPSNLGLITKQLRCLGRFLVVCLLLNRRQKVQQLLHQFKVLLEECRRLFQETDIKEWKHVLHEMVRFLKVDSDFMNIRPLRYSLVLDAHLGSVPHVLCEKKVLSLRDAILSSYHHNEVKFTELTLDTFRMLQCLEWEPGGSFYHARDCESKNDGKEEGLSGNSATTHIMHMEDISDPSLPPNPQKTVLYRPSATHLLAVLATLCEEMAFDGILLIYLSGKGRTVSRSSETGHTIVVAGRNSSDLQGNDAVYNGITSSPVTSPNGSPTTSEARMDRSDCSGSYLLLGSHGERLYPCDLIPFTRKPLFFIIDSNCSPSFKDISGAEKGERPALLLSPISSSLGASSDTARYSNGSQFTMFLTAPLQAFCHLVGLSTPKAGMNAYHEAERLLSGFLVDWGCTLATSGSLDPVWVRVFDDPLLRRLILRFIFCRAVLSLYVPTFNQAAFVPECVPPLPDSVLPMHKNVQSAVFGIANVLGVCGLFIFSDGVLQQGDFGRELAERVETMDLHKRNAIPTGKHG